MNDFKDSYNATKQFLAFNAGWMWAIFLYVVLPIVCILVIVGICTAIKDMLEKDEE